MALQRMRIETLVGVLSQRALQRQGVTPEMVRVIAPLLADLFTELYADHSAFYTDPQRSKLWQALRQAAQQGQQTAYQPPPAAQSIDGPTPSPPSVTGSISGQQANTQQPRSGVTQLPPRPVPVQAPPMPQPARQQPQPVAASPAHAPAPAGPPPRTPVAPQGGNSDAPPGMTEPPPAPPAFD